MEFEAFQVGQKVLVELQKKKLRGEFREYDAKMQVIRVANLMDFNTMRHYTRLATFATHEIVAIHAIDDTEREETLDGSTEASMTVVLTDEEITVAQNALCNFSYITQTNKQYFAAMEELKEAEKVAVDVIGGRKGRFSPQGSLLAMATRKKIYIIDLKNLGCIPGEVKHILEARLPQKIIHDSCIVADFFLAHRIRLTSVSDTWIAHTAVTGSTRPVSVRECIQEHLKIPITPLTDKDDVALGRRPLNIDQCALVAEQVAFLHHLNTVLLERNLFKPYYDACKAYKNGLSQYDDPAFAAVRVGAANFQEFVEHFELF